MVNIEMTLVFTGEKVLLKESPFFFGRLTNLSHTHTHKCVNTFNCGPPVVLLLFVLKLLANYLHWFCTRFPTVDLLTIVDPIVLYCYRSTV